MNPLFEVIAELLIFSAVALMTVTVMREVERLVDQRRRLGSQTVTGLPSTPLLAKRISENAFFRWMQEHASISDPEKRQKLRQALILAGFDNPNAFIWYAIGRFLLALLLPGLFILMQFFAAKPATGFGVVVWPLVLCGVGLY